MCTEEAWALCIILSADSAHVKCQATDYFFPHVHWCFILTACGGEDKSLVICDDLVTVSRWEFS